MEDTRLVTGAAELRRIDPHATNAVLADEAWAAHGCYAAFGVAWEMQSDDVSAYHLLLDRLPPGAVPNGSKVTVRSYALRTLPATFSECDPSYLLLADGRPLVRSSEVADVADAFEQDLKWLVAERSPRRVFLRAGVVGWRDRAIVLPGGPGTGKSTLVRALLAAGATYFSDEYAVLEGNLVQPYPARQVGWSAAGNVLSHWLAELTPARVVKPVPVGVVLFAPYQAGAIFKPKLIARGKSLLGMFKHAVAAQRNPEHVLRALDVVSRRCNALEGVHGDARTAAAFLLDRLV
jgi:hypothetical protein